jgi:hypothetical protein
MKTLSNHPIARGSALGRPGRKPEPPRQRQGDGAGPGGPHLHKESSKTTPMKEVRMARKGNARPFRASKQHEIPSTGEKRLAVSNPAIASRYQTTIGGKHI